MSTKTTKPAVTAAGIKPKECYLSENSIIKFRFHEDDLDVVRDGEKVWVALRRACENLGMDYSGQLAKLKRYDWAGMEMISIPSPGGAQEAAFLDLEAVPMWLATIDVNRVKEEHRAKLVRYQKECARVLRDYFFGRSIDRQVVS